MDIKAIIHAIVDVAKAVAPTIVPGGTAAIAAAESVVALIDKAKDIFAEHDQSELEAVRSDLVARVNAHADKTIASLDAEHQADTGSRSGH